MHCFILAGGFATRLWPLTEKRAKPLLPLAGKPILTHLIEHIPDDLPITVSTNAVFKNEFEKWKKDINRAVSILIEDTTHDDHKLGALGALAKWIREKNIHEDVLLLTGDNYCGFSFKEFIGAFCQSTLLAVYDIGDIKRAKDYGTVLTNKNMVTAFEEKPARSKTKLVNTGASLLPRRILPMVIEFAKRCPDNVGGMFEELLRRQESVECFRFSEVWFDIGSFESYLEATKTLVGNAVSNTGHHAEHSIMEESVVIGAGSCVTKSTMRNVVIFENCRINDCVLKDCIIDNNCILSHVDLTRKMIREGTILDRK